LAAGSQAAAAVLSELNNGEIRITLLISMLLLRSAQMNASREKIAQCSQSEKVFQHKITPVHVIFSDMNHLVSAPKLQETELRAGHATFQSDISHLTLKIK